MEYQPGRSDYFAAAALEAMIASNVLGYTQVNETYFRSYAVEAFKMADAMEKERPIVQQSDEPEDAATAA